VYERERKRERETEKVSRSGEDGRGAVEKKGLFLFQRLLLSKAAAN